ncbi:type II toxin-antitoxin system Phd/YefM family antitoxin [Kineococcus arenarius]|uniref:type II toxin-antitoxin system Phd/YefM family antitoxin n=1 Tax=unclassified Kineococcus TaxID=2621656 RepID=UPI003D7E8DC2
MVELPPVAGRCYGEWVRTISQRELRNDSGKVLRERRDGEEFEVTINGESFGILRMGPPPAEPQRFASADALRALYADAPLSAEQADAWKRDIRNAFDDELDDPCTRAARRREP